TRGGTPGPATPPGGGTGSSAAAPPARRALRQRPGTVAGAPGRLPPGAGPDRRCRCGSGRAAPGPPRTTARTAAAPDRRGGPPPPIPPPPPAPAAIPPADGAVPPATARPRCGPASGSGAPP